MYVDVIQNDSLRGAISSIYELSYPYYHNYEQERIQFKIHHVTPLLLENFTWLSDPAKYFRSSYEILATTYAEIQQEGTLLKLVHATAMENDVVQNRAKRIEQEILQLLGFLEHELTSR